MIDFLTLQTKIFGLDISDLSLKIIQLKKNKDSFNLVSFKEAKIKPGIIRKGKIKKEKALVEIIKKAISEVKGEKIRTKYVIASLPEESAYLQVIKMPMMSKKSLESAIIYEAENYIPLPLEKVYLDFEIIPSINEKQGSLEVLLVCIPKEVVDSYISCFKKSGLKPMVLETESLSISRSLIKNKFSKEPLLLVDMGATRTGIIAFLNKSLRFASFIPVSSRYFTNAISKSLNIELPEAEKLKIKYGVSRKTKEANKIFDALIPSLTDLTEQIKKHLDFYSTHTCSKDKKIKKIILCGGGANLKGIEEFFSSELKIVVERGNPLINILTKQSKEKSVLSTNQALVYATAIGLALKGSKKI